MDATLDERVRVTVPVTIRETRSSDGQLKLAGLAAPYSAESLDMGFHEVLLPGAFRRSLARPDGDLLLLWQHKTDQPLARQGAGLAVRETARGVEFDAVLPPTSLARDAVELVRAGVIRGMSFGFTVREDRWEQRNGRNVRLVVDADLHELSLVSLPAYGDHTEVANRQRLARRIERSAERMRSGQPRTRCPYTSDPRQSFFRDLVVAAALASDGYGDPGLLRDRDRGGVDEARERLRLLDLHLREARDLTTSAGDGGGFVSTGPRLVQSTFDRAVRDRAALPGVLPRRKLPDKGMTIGVPRVTTAVDAAVQATENTAVNETELVEALLEQPVVAVAGLCDLSVQLFERAEPGLDQYIAGELGAAIATQIDRVLIEGSASPALTGLRAAAHHTVSYDDATPTAAEALPALAQAAARVADQVGYPPDVLLMHPRRLAWLGSNLASTTPLLDAIPFNMRLVPCSNITTTYGTPTASQDELFVLATPELPFYTSELRFETLRETLSAEGTVRLVARGYLSALFAARPEAVARVSGTGLVGWF